MKLILLVASSSLAHAVLTPCPTSGASYGSDLCSNPVVSTANLPANTKMDVYIGQCVNVVWTDRTVSDGQTRSENIVLGANGIEGRCGTAGGNIITAMSESYWKECLVHDLCVSSNYCRSDSIKSGIPFNPFAPDWSDDPDCGDELGADAAETLLLSKLYACNPLVVGTCPSGQNCEFTSNLYQCRSTKPIGSFCYQNDDCNSGYCDATFECASKKPNGASCATDASCASGVCNWSGFMFLCTDKQRNGASCVTGDACLSGYCNSSFDCASKKPSGAWCATNNSCQSGRCKYSWRGPRCT